MSGGEGVAVAHDDLALAQRDGRLDYVRLGSLLALVRGAQVEVQVGADQRLRQLEQRATLHCRLISDHVRTLVDEFAGLLLGQDLFVLLQPALLFRAQLAQQDDPLLRVEREPLGVVDNHARDWCRDLHQQVLVPDREVG